MRTPESEILGRRVFERTGCVKCHIAVGGNTERAPALAGLGKAQKPAYLVESILDPSAIIKTGYETETIVTHDGMVPDGQHKTMSPAEFAGLIHYLQSL